MTREEKINKLCEKVMVSEEEADAALSACNDDILDAVLYLETLGKVRNPKVAEYVEEPVKSSKKEEKKVSRKSESFGEAFGKFCKWIMKLVKAGCDNDFVVTKDGEIFFQLPIIIPTILLIPLGWLEIILLVIGLFCGCAYSFSGPAFKKDGKANRFSEQVSSKTNSFKEDFNRTYYGEDDNQ